MESVIEKLFDGRIIPSEMPGPADACTLGLKERYRQSYEALSGKLDPSLRKELGNVVDNCTAVDAQDSAAFFAQGFRLGAVMMLDVLYGRKT